jgi:hypothetical protein
MTVGPINPASLIVRDPDMVAAEMDGDLVMMSIERDEYFGIAGVGTRAWELLEQPMTVEQICAVIGTEFEVDEATCREDMLGFANELLTLGLVKLS